MKICLINNLYEPFTRGGAEKITKIIAQGLIQAGHEVLVITTKPYGEKISGLGRALKIYYLNSWYYNLSKLPKFLRLLWHFWNMFDIVSYFKIKKILGNEKCDAVITNNLMGLGFLTPLAVRRLELKHLHLVHDMQLIYPSGLLLFGQEKIIDRTWARNYAGLCSRLFASPRAVIFPSRWLRDRYLDKIFFIKSKRVVLPNPLAPPAAVNFKTAGDNFKFLYLGQIEKHKGLNLLIQSFKKVKEKFPRIELIIAGAGAELENTKLEAQGEGSIKFLGRINETQVNELLHASHSLVVPTLCYENCPTVILESFSAGLPVLAADLGGISELLGEDAAGLLFRPGNVRDLAEKMTWAIEHQSDLAEMSRAGKTKAALSGVENYIRELENLIKL